MARFLLLAAACSFCACAAHAQHQTAVSTRGLDLRDPADAKAFYRRLSQAVADSCGGAPTYFLGSEEERFQTCFKPAMDEAVAQTHAPLVSALHSGRTAYKTRLAKR